MESWTTKFKQTRVSRVRESVHSARDARDLAESGHPIASALFAVVERLVCMVDQGLFVLSVSGPDPKTDADGAREWPLVGLIDELLELGANSVRDDPCFLDVGVVENDRKFFAAVAGGQIGLAQVVLKAFGDLSEDFVSDRMSVGIVDVFEVIDVREQDAEGALGAFVSGDRLVELGLELSVIGQPGEAIGGRHRLHLFVKPGVLHGHRDLIPDDLEHFTALDPELIGVSVSDDEGPDGLVLYDQREYEKALETFELLGPVEDHRRVVSQNSAVGEVVSVSNDHWNETVFGVEFEVEPFCSFGECRGSVDGDDRVGLALGVECRDRGEIVGGDLCRAFERNAVDIFWSDDAVEFARGVEEAPELVFGLLDRCERSLVFNGSYNVGSHVFDELYVAVVERS